MQSTWRRRRREIWLLGAGILLWLGQTLGLWDHLLWETSFTYFSWPVDVNIARIAFPFPVCAINSVVKVVFMFEAARGNIQSVQLERRGGPVPVRVLNNWSFTFLHRPPLRCHDDPDARPRRRFHILVKSAVEHFAHRQIGRSMAEAANAAVGREIGGNGDVLVVENVVDSYRNNTLKMLAGFAALIPCKYEAALFVDDDYFVSPLRAVETWLQTPKRELLGLGSNLYVGSLIRSSPFRNRWHKHYVPVSTYPYNAYPPYITAGAYLLSADSVRNLFIASRYTALYNFDDVYLGILAYRLGLPLTHSTQFLAYQEGWSEWWTEPDWATVVAVHGVTGLQPLVEAVRKSDDRLAFHF